MSQQNKLLVTRFIETIWNNQQLGELNTFLHADYSDHSFLPAIPPTGAGLHLWITTISKAFTHATIIESIIAEGDQVALRISFKVKHIGLWRNIEPTGKEVIIKGFRFFIIKEDRIFSHFALIDGEALQTALQESHHGCSLQ